METVTALLGLCVGYLIGKGWERKNPPEEPEQPLELPKTLKIQMDNFMAYDGTARGQKELED